MSERERKIRVSGEGRDLTRKLCPLVSFSSEVWRWSLQAQGRAGQGRVRQGKTEHGRAGQCKGTEE